MNVAYMTMIEVRAELYALSEAMGYPRLKELADRTKRTTHAPRGRNDSVKMTDEIKQQIKAMKAEFPSRTLGKLGQLHKVSMGRASEALYGKKMK